MSDVTALAGTDPPISSIERGERGSALVGRARRLGGVRGGRPAAEQLERLFGTRTGLGGIGEDRQPGVGRKVQRRRADACSG
jgi:hypothetical protein